MVLADDRGFSVHWRHEVGVGRYDTVRVQRFATLEAAAVAVAGSWERGIDGIPIDEAG